MSDCNIVEFERVAPLVCEGPVQLTVTAGGIATLVFTHRQMDVALAAKDGTVRETAFVQARIVMSVATLKEVRDSLNKMKALA